MSFTLSEATPSMMMSGGVELTEEEPRRVMSHDSSPGADDERVMITPGTWPCMA